MLQVCQLVKAISMVAGCAAGKHIGTVVTKLGGMRGTPVRNVPPCSVPH